MIVEGIGIQQLLPTPSLAPSSTFDALGDCADCVETLTRHVSSKKNAPKGEASTLSLQTKFPFFAKASSSSSFNPSFIPFGSFERMGSSLVAARASQIDI